MKQPNIQDISRGLVCGIHLSRHHILKAYFYTPLGCILLFLVLYGFNRFLVEVHFNFPPSVLVMIINLFSLLILHYILPRKYFNVYFKLIEVPMQFALRWINTFFIPSFVILPLTSPISIIECIKIAAVFIIGYLVLACIVAYTCILLQLVFKNSRNADKSNTSNSDEELEDEIEAGAAVAGDRDIEQQRSSMDSIELSNLNRPEPTYAGSSILPSDQTSLQSYSKTSEDHELISKHDSNDIKSNENMKKDRKYLNEHQYYYTDLSTNSKLIAHYTALYFDWIMYSVLFVAGLPIYYTHNITLFLHLAITILCFYTALLIPAFYRRFLHPILVSVAAILLLIFLTSIIRSHGRNLKSTFLDAISSYKTGRIYTTLFDTTTYPHWPGCGDVLTSMMDIAIVSLSLPMFNYRRDLKNNFFVLVPPILLSCVICFFGYPPLCYHIGISSSMSLGFVGRSVTLALGTPLVKSLDGSVSLMAVCTILSGILGVLSGNLMLGPYGLRVKKDDYVTRGVTLGISCGAISTAHLLTVDPRAASMSSLSFSLFGTIMVIMASITQLAHLIKGWAGMS